MHLHGQREPFPPGTVAEGSCWTFPGKFRIWMRVPSSALLPASCTWARQPSDPCAGHSPPRDTAPGHFPGSHPEGHRAALPQAAARLFHPKPVPCRTQSEKKNPTKKTQRQTLQNNLLQSGERCRRLAAGLAREVPVEERKGVSLAERSSTKSWAGHWCCWQEPGMLS